MTEQDIMNDCLDLAIKQYRDNPNETDKQTLEKIIDNHFLILKESLIKKIGDNQL
jgi:hypothetical protein